MISFLSSLHPPSSLSLSHSLALSLSLSHTLSPPSHLHSPFCTVGSIALKFLLKISLQPHYFSLGLDCSCPRVLCSSTVPVILYFPSSFHLKVLSLHLSTLLHTPRDSSLLTATPSFPSLVFPPGFSFW